MIEYIGNELELFQFATNWKNYFSSKIKKHISGDVLEVGSGYGVNTKYLITENSKTWTFIEPDPKLASKIESFTNQISIEKKVIVGTIENVLNKKYDTIIYIDVLEHIENSKEELVKISKLLKPNGYLIILVPAFQFLFSDFDSKIGHFRRYNKSLLRMEIDNRFTEKKLFYLDSCGFFASMVNKIFLKKSDINLNQVKFWDKILVPISKISDRLLFNKIGKSLIGLYQIK
jgi:2-polyprenyl-3-methyl-5-hydroxy-6-metoxy-1,4-benzoquinol methylase